MEPAADLGEFANKLGKRPGFLVLKKQIWSLLCPCIDEKRWNGPSWPVCLAGTWCVVWPRIHDCIFPRLRTWAGGSIFQFLDTLIYNPKITTLFHHSLLHHSLFHIFKLQITKHYTHKGPESNISAQLLSAYLYGTCFRMFLTIKGCLYSELAPGPLPDRIPGPPSSEMMPTPNVAFLSFPDNIHFSVLGLTFVGGNN